MRSGIKTKRHLLPKDLLNDLEREENIKERIRRTLDRPIDPTPMLYPERIDATHLFSSSTVMSTAMAVNFNQIPWGMSFPR